MKRLVLLGVVLALVCAAAGSAAPPSVKAIAAARERVAARKAERLLLRVPLPAGAIRLSHVPVRDLGMTTPEAGVSVDTMGAERHGFWRVRQPVAFVIRFVEAHPVWGLTENGGAGLQDGAQTVRFYGQGSPMGRMVVVSAVGDRGWTFIRVDSAVAWIYPRSPSEALPSGVREIDIRAGGVSRRLSDRAKVARVVRWFGEPTVTPPTKYTTSCDGPVFSATVTFIFRSASGAEVARASVPSGAAWACDPIEFFVHGKAQTPLIDIGAAKDAFVARVERLLGVCFGAGPRGGRRPTPLCNKQWAGEEAAQLLQRFRLPAGAQVLARAPRGDGGLLHAPESISGGDELVDQHRLWIVRRPLAAVVAFVKREHGHWQPGPDIGGPGIPFNQSVTYTYVPRNGIIASRTLEVMLVTLPDGSTGVRADAQVVWIYPRTLYAPPARTGDVIVVRAGSTMRRVTDYRTLERITYRFDRLGIVQPGVIFHCPAAFVRGPAVRIEFHGVDPTVAARAVARDASVSTACDPIRFSVHGRTEQLVGRDLVSWLERLLGMRR